MLETFCLDLPDQPPQSSLERISTSIQCSDMASFKRRRNKQQIQTIIIHWCRTIITDSQLLLYINSKVVKCIINPIVFKRRWSSQHHKSPLIQLADNDKSAIIHQQSFRKKKQIKFDQLSKTHYIQCGESIPYKTKNGIVFSASISFEIYEHFVGDKLDRNDCALNGSHKIGIASNINNPKTKKKYFIGLSSTYNQHYHRKSSFLYGNMHTRHKQEGVLFIVDIDGKKKAVKNGIAFRKFETITMSVDWINKLLVFKRQLQNESSEYRSKNESWITIDLKSNILDSLDVMKMEWCPCVAMCLDQTDSFMWNNQVDDFIRITLLPGDIL